MTLFYSIVVACTLDLLICVPLPDHTHPFVTKTGCAAYVMVVAHRLYGRDLDHPVVMGRCRHMVIGR